MEMVAIAGRVSHGTRGHGSMRRQRDRRRTMEQPRRTEFTADEFIAWALEQATGRFELDNGAVVAMAPERIDHTRAKRNATIALHNAIGARGCPCEVLPDGASVRINERTVYEPDALVRCGPLSPGGEMEVSDPVIVVEVVSPSSRGIDTGSKLAAYFSLPSVLHYLIVDTDKRLVIHHHRDGKGEIGVRDPRGGPAFARSPGLDHRRPGPVPRDLKNRFTPQRWWSSFAAQGSIFPSTACPRSASEAMARLPSSASPQ